MSHTCTHFQSAELLRIVDGTWSKQPGCHSEPFFSIPVRNVVLDELHLMLRITDRLEEGLIYDITKWDKVNIKQPFCCDLIEIPATIFTHRETKQSDLPKKLTEFSVIWCAHEAYIQLTKTFYPNTTNIINCLVFSYSWQLILPCIFAG